MVVTGATPLAGQLVVLFCGAMLSPLVYFLVRDLFEVGFDSEFATRSSVAGMLAGLIIAVAGQPILSSIVIMADIPALFLATLAVWLLVKGLNGVMTRGGEDARTRRFSAPHRLFASSPLLLAAAGATLALAVITRWIYTLLVPALIAYTLYRLWYRPKLWWYPLLAVAGGMLILTPQLWITFNTPTGLSHSWLTGWHPANALQTAFTNIDGHFVYLLPNGLFYAQPAGHPAYIFPLLGLASLWGVWQLWRAKQWGPLILLPGWAGPVYIFLAGIPYQNFRFGLTLAVPPIILAAFGLAEIYTQWRHPSPASSPLRLVFVACLVAMLAWAIPMLNSFLSAQNQSKIIARQVEQAVPPRATIIAFGLTLTLKHYTKPNTVELFHLDQPALERLAQNQASLYLLVNPHNIDTQWQGKLPHRHIQWLRAHTTLTEIDRFPPYVLYTIERIDEGRRTNDD
jgi:4-amino-4-deoxy-L-arabinose transferase-like glycosyltransferase